MINKNVLKTVILAVVTYFFILFENKCITVSKYCIESSKIKNNNFNIVHISDLHNTEFGHKNKRLIKRIKKLEPNIIVITGDIVDCHKTNVYCALNFVKEASNICPTYYVCGNHEGVLGGYKKLTEDLTKSGAVVLNNTSVYIDNGLKIIGITDPYIKLIERPDEFLKCEVKSSDFNILLSHRPQLLSMYAESGCDLVFSGHAHGGQIRLPFIGGLFAPDQGILPKYTSGVYKEKNTNMVVSRGLGNSVFPFRFFNRPEIVLVTLKNSR